MSYLWEEAARKSRLSGERRSAKNVQLRVERPSCSSPASLDPRLDASTPSACFSYCRYSHPWDQRENSGLKSHESEILAMYTSQSRNKCFGSQKAPTFPGSKARIKAESVPT
jgi:hypothetical protein